MLETPEDMLDKIRHVNKATVSILQQQINRLTPFISMENSWKDNAWYLKASSTYEGLANNEKKHTNTHQEHV